MPDAIRWMTDDLRPVGRGLNRASSIVAIELFDSEAHKLDVDQVEAGTCQRRCRAATSRLALPRARQPARGRAYDGGRSDRREPFDHGRDQNPTRGRHGIGAGGIPRSGGPSVRADQQHDRHSEGQRVRGGLSPSPPTPAPGCITGSAATRWPATPRMSSWSRWVSRGSGNELRTNFRRRVRPRVSAPRPPEINSLLRSVVLRGSGRGPVESRDRRQLFLSTKTIEFHLSKVFAKLETSSRVQLRTALGTSHEDGSLFSDTETEPAGRTRDSSARTAGDRSYRSTCRHQPHRRALCQTNPASSLPMGCGPMVRA